MPRVECDRFGLKKEETLKGRKYEESEIKELTEKREIGIPSVPP